MGERYHELKKRIVAFRATVLETHARFKLGQDENDVTFKEIVTSLGDRTLAEWMDRTRV
jgi:transcriptional regulator